VITYRTDLAGITPSMLDGFFVGWPNPPSPETHLRLLAGSYAVVLATDDDTGQVVGFINAISDGVLAAFIPLLEVLPTYQGRGIGSELVSRLSDLLADFYGIDLLCDDDVVPFYDRLGFQRASAGMYVRNYQHQSGRP